MSKNTYWLADEAGNKALVTGADERDRFLPLGWSLAEEPVDNELVWARHEGIADAALFPAQALAAWAAKGWVAGAPPEPVNPLNDGSLPVTAVTPLVGADAADENPPSTRSKTAASGTTKES